MRAYTEVLQPIVAVVLILRVAVVVLASLAWRCVHASVVVATTQQPAGLAPALKQVGERAPATRLDIEHPAKSRSRLARQQTEDRLGTSTVERRDAVRALTPCGRLRRLGRRRGRLSVRGRGRLDVKNRRGDDADLGRGEDIGTCRSTRRLHRRVESGSLSHGAHGEGLGRGAGLAKCEH